jgi:predicted ATPase
MMLTELHLSNFKSWRELDMKLGQVTGLFGTNSSGKSSILQFLLMLKQTAESSDKELILDLGGQSQLVNLGSFKDFIFKHQESLSLKWEMVWKKSAAKSNFFLQREYIKNTVEIILLNKEMKVEFIRSQIDDDVLTINPVHVLNKTYTFQKNNEVPTAISLQPTVGLLFPKEIVNDVYYLAPLREYPKREYHWSGGSPSHVGYRGENAINAILAATIRNETRTLPNSNEEKPFQEIIAYWLKELGLIYEFSVKEIAEGTGLFRAIVKKSPESPEAFLTDVGFGVSQVLPALVLLYYVPEGSIILMEQPEIHLHPSVQSGLADVILQVSKQRNLQVIVESHSEHLLRRFQRRIAEESYPADEIKLYFCDMKEGESKLVDLEINEYGEIENWPENFFGDEMAEIAATRIAGLERKIKNAAKNAN